MGSARGCFGRIRAISSLADAWLTPGSTWMRRAEREIPSHTPYSSEMVRACLKRVFKGYDADSLRQWVERDHVKDVVNLHPSSFILHPSKYPRILVVSPSTVFAATWQAATAAWLAGCCPVLKPSRREPIFARLLYESARSMAGNILPIEVLSPTFCLNLSPVTRHPSPLISHCSFAAIVIYGNDQTIGNLARKNRVIAFGPRISIAVISKSTPRNQLAKIAKSAALDAVLYDTQGCLSPQGFFVEQGGSISEKDFARALSDAMQQLDSRLPLVAVIDEAIEEESFWQRWRFRASQGRAQVFRRHVILHSEPHFEPCGLRRVVFVTPLKNAGHLAMHCGEWMSQISTIAASDAPLLARLKQKFGTRAGIRLCEIGQMHEPPPLWRNGGINLPGEISKRS